jgi:hypothetical protein
MDLNVLKVSNTPAKELAQRVGRHLMCPSCKSVKESGLDVPSFFGRFVAVRTGPGINDLLTQCAACEYTAEKSAFMVWSLVEPVWEFTT